MKERTNCSKQQQQQERCMRCRGRCGLFVQTGWTQGAGLHTLRGFCFCFFCFVFVFATLFTDVFSQTAPQRGRGDPLTTSHGQRCGLCRDAVTVLQKKQKCVVRVCEFVDRVSQIRVLGYLSRFLFVCFFVFVFFSLLFLFFFLLFFSFLLSPFFFFFFFFLFSFLLFFFFFLIILYCAAHFMD